MEEEPVSQIQSMDSSPSQESLATPLASITKISLEISQKMESTPPMEPKRPSYLDVARQANLKRAQLDQFFVLEADAA